MPAKATELTIREKAAIVYQLTTGTAWTECYKIASKSEFEKINNSKHLAVLASNWKNTNKVQKFIQEFTTIQEGKRQKEIDNAIIEDRQDRGDNESTENRKRKEGKFVDYSDPANRKRLYNEVIAGSGDDYKTKLDAAKVFEQIQKDDREAARVQKQQRVYLPIVCNECPLYMKAHKRTTK